MLFNFHFKNTLTISNYPGASRCGLNELGTHQASTMVADTVIFIEHLRAKDKLSTTLYEISEKTAIYISAVTVWALYLSY